MSARSVISDRPIAVFAGPFGTGKTEVAINYARAALRAGRKACLVDLDIVTPYFRVGDYREELASEGIQVIAAPGDLASFEVPALPPEIAGALAAENVHVVADAGGDPVGARLLAVYAEQVTGRGYDMWLVANPFRPAASTPDAIVREAAEIEHHCGLRFTGLLANPNLGALTEPRDICRGLEVAREAAARLALPLALAAERRLLSRLPSTNLPSLPLDLTVRMPWVKPARQV